ncbi:MAG: DMT family transporter [Oligoflexia bacterium]
MTGALAALGSSVTWAIGTQVYPRLSREHSPFEVNGSRALVALPLFLLAGLWVDGLEGWGAVSGANYGWMFLSMVSSYFLGDACFLWSTQALGVPGALAIASTYPVWTALAGSVLKGEHLVLQQGVGVGFAVLGTLLVILSGFHLSRKAGASRHYARGVLFGVLTSGFWALNSWAVAAGGRGISALVGNSIRMAFALVLCSAASMILRKKASIGLPVKVLAPHLPVFVFEAFGGSLLFLYGLTHTSLAVASALSSLAPVLAVPLAGWRKSEPLTASKVIGVCVAVLGVVLLLTA